MSTIKAVLFDFDGTLSLSGAIDFKKIRSAINCPADQPILEYIAGIKDPQARQRASDILNQYELKAAAKTQEDPSAAKAVCHLIEQGMQVGIITRNSRQAVMRAFDNFKNLKLSQFDLLITRDNSIEPKPSAAGIYLAAGKWQIEPDQILVVGDYIFDIQAGQNAGSPTVLLDRGLNLNLSDMHCDFKISDLKELCRIIQLTHPLNTGKLPNDILADFLQQFQFSDSSVLVSAGIGDDTAAINVNGKEVIVLKSDPITFATDAISQYAVLVNANDIATAGAVPRWFLTTLLFPPKTTAFAIRKVMNDLFHTCNAWGITLCGGHTEITDAVTRPVVIGMMAGTVCRADLIEKTKMQPGNQILLTKSVAVEGTAIIAREFSDDLLSMGLSPKEIQAGQNFLAQISILPEARLAASTKAATAMHDVTEGGLATAIEELSISGGHRLRVNMEAIPYFDLTRKIGELLNINPLGLIGSGSLLICCKEEDCSNLMKTFTKQGIAVACIGRILEPGQGIEAYEHGKRVVWPHFKVDEITRLFNS